MNNAQTGSPEEYADLDDTRLYVRTTGSGEALVLIHGFALDQRMWDDQAAALADSYCVVRYDMRGFGRSAVPAGAGYRHYTDLQRLLDHLGIQKAHLIGHSKGGGAALDFALAYPERTQRLLLLSPMVQGYWFDEFGTFSAEVWKTGREKGTRAAMDKWLQGDLFIPMMARPQVAVRGEEIMRDYSGWVWKERDPEQRPDPSTLDRLEEIEAPVLVIIGALDVPDFQELAKLIAERVPNAQLEVIDDAGHMANMETPHKFNQLVRTFLSAKSAPR